MVSDKYNQQWEAVRPRIEADIEKHRKGDLTLKVRDRAGKPVAGQRVSIEQTNSAFLFGANLFMVGWYDDASLAKRYEDAYVGLFNAGTVSLYWRDLEPTPGQLRFAKDSVKIRRRPPVDLAVEFGQKHGLNLSGHPLVWDFIKWSVPDWLTDEQSINGALWEQRIAQIAERYGRAIKRWDVVNEVIVTEERLKKGLSRPMPSDYARAAFRWSEKYLPASAHLMINETSGLWWGDRDPYLALVRRLIDDGARVDGIGLQFHLFADAEIGRVGRGEIYTPEQLFDVLDRAAAFGRPLHLSEITLTSPRNDPDGAALQAEVARNYYRMWFSHPAVHAITWWNVPDGAAAPGEDTVDSGLLDKNMNPKPAYEVLRKLIRDEWRTRLDAVTDADGVVRFRGFHGDYRVRLANESAPFALTPGGGEAVATIGGGA